MKIFIFAYDRLDLTTSAYFKEHPHTILCHTEEQKQALLSGGNCYGEVIATHQPKGLPRNRNVALEMMQEGEWAVFFVDDLLRVTAITELESYMSPALEITTKNQKMFRQMMGQQIDATKFLEICEDTVREAAAKGHALCGFSLTENPLFRTKKFSYWGLADGRCWVVKKTALRFDERSSMMDDYCFTALNMREFGGLTINNYLHPLCGRYTKGGYGTKAERMKEKIEECDYLVSSYPEYISHAEKVGFPTGSHIRMRSKRTGAETIKMF